MTRVILLDNEISDLQHRLAEAKKSGDRDFQSERRTERRLAELNAELETELAASGSTAPYDGD